VSKTKVTLRVKTKGHQVGDVIEVDAATADHLEEMRQADRVRPKADDKA
jgi:hypothetical protein